MQIVEFGDSRTYGNNDTASQNNLGIPAPLPPNYNGGGNTSLPTLTLSGGSGTGGELGVVLNASNGIVLYVKHRGRGYTSTGMPTITLAGVTGQAASFDWTYVSNQPAGGYTDKLETLLRQNSAYSTIELINVGLGGTTSLDFLPTGNNYLAVVSSAVDAATTPWIWCDLGVNDARSATPTTATAYYNNMKAIGDALIARGHHFIIDKPFGDSLTDASVTPLAGYRTQIDNLIATNPGTASTPGYHLGIDANAQFTANASVPGWYVDIVHPGPLGNTYIAQQRAARFLALFPPTVAPAAPASLTAAAPVASVVLTWPAAASATGYRVRKDGVTTPIYDGAGLTFTDTFALGTSHTYTVAAYNGGGESTLTAPITVTALTTSLSLTVTPATGANNLAWLSDPQAANGYAVLWMPGSALPVVGATGEVVGKVAQGTLTWADTSAYRIALSAGSRYEIISLH